MKTISELAGVRRTSLSLDLGLDPKTLKVPKQVTLRIPVQSLAEATHPRTQLFGIQKGSPSQLFPLTSGRYREIIVFGFSSLCLASTAVPRLPRPLRAPSTAGMWRRKVGVPVLHRAEPVSETASCFKAVGSETGGWLVQRGSLDKDQICMRVFLRLGSWKHEKHSEFTVSDATRKPTHRAMGRSSN